MLTEGREAGIQAGMFPSINRSVVIITPKKAYIEWANSCATLEDEPEWGPDDLTGNAYLMEENATGSDDEFRYYVEKHWRDIADEEFMAWCTVEDTWPELRNVADFERYFKWECRELVFDLADDDLVLEDDEEELPDFSAN
ncbi:hypothetical protein H5P28_04545 [Ruficoccus amylovorans]|uniref:Uncharacterized protein n=1 Tax=Ruficoccus amylovorans TaxID=1804625 RepID=A0A842HAX7_9BACT|nr:hypothetical protein [Ruficoccus amylovorans]MBC2593525.1 hypothetical protein [Ruficoccus amylovorans]